MIKKFNIIQEKMRSSLRNKIKITTPVFILHREQNGQNRVLIDEIDNGKREF